MRNIRNLTWLWIGLGVLLVAVVRIWLLQSISASNAGNSATRPADSAAISPAQAYTKLQQGVFFLDVRTQTEWNHFHVQGSTLIPLEHLQGRLNELPKDREIVVVCLTGQRSQGGAGILQQAGFKQVTYVNGGLQAWVAAGYPVQSGTP